jgi:hypothetical protein
MPTILRQDGYRFFFWSNEGREPPHVHIAKGGAEAKCWLDPIEFAWQADFTPAQIRVIRRIVETNQATFLAEWRRHFAPGG